MLFISHQSLYLTVISQVPGKSDVIFPIFRNRTENLLETLFGLENLTNVAELPESGFGLIALPMKIEGGTGGPTRVVAVVPQ